MVETDLCLMIIIKNTVTTIHSTQVKQNTINTYYFLICLAIVVGPM